MVQMNAVTVTNERRPAKGIFLENGKAVFLDIGSGYTILPDSRYDAIVAVIPEVYDYSTGLAKILCDASNRSGSVNF